jgi:hypothetical protein
LDFIETSEYDQYKEEYSFSSELDEAAEKYRRDTCNEACKQGFLDNYPAPSIKDAFIAGAEWQKEQDTRDMFMSDNRHFQKIYELGKKDMKDEFEKNRLAACDRQTQEEYDREVEFATEIINKEHRKPTFSDAINYGIEWQKKHGGK